jgi:hypothetical protein
VITIQNVKGRLVELRMEGEITQQEFAESAAEFGAVIERIPGPVVLFTDNRALKVLPQDVAVRLLEVMRNDNPKIERNGVLASRSAVLALQMERLFRNAGGATRRLFRDAPDLEQWLGEVLTLTERERLHRILA